MNIVIRIFTIAFILVTAIADVYVFICVLCPSKCIVFAVSIMIERWLVLALMKWIVISIYFLTKFLRKETACRKMPEILARHEGEIDKIWNELNYLNENALIIDNKKS